MERYLAKIFPSKENRISRNDTKLKILDYLNRANP